MFIETEATADPARLRFLPGREVLAAGTLDLRDRASAAASPLAERLFAIAGVAAVALERDAITVTRAGRDWQHLKPAILGAIMEHYMAGTPTLRPAAAADRGGAADRIREALRGLIDPELGYNIVDLGLVYDVTVDEGGVATVVMTTTTPGCPATSYLKAGAGEAAATVEGVELVDVKLTYEPRWTPERMTPAARAHLGIRDRGAW